MWTRLSSETASIHTSTRFSSCDLGYQQPHRICATGVFLGFCSGGWQVVGCWLWRGRRKRGWRIAWRTHSNFRQIQLLTRTWFCRTDCPHCCLKANTSTENWFKSNLDLVQIQFAEVKFNVLVFSSGSMKAFSFRFGLNVMRQKWLTKLKNK